MLTDDNPGDDLGLEITEFKSRIGTEAHGLLVFPAESDFTRAHWIYWILFWSNN